jgi:hypothetical protein
VTGRAIDPDVGHAPGVASAKILASASVVSRACLKFTACVLPASGRSRTAMTMRCQRADSMSPNWTFVRSALAHRHGR